MCLHYLCLHSSPTHTFSISGQVLMMSALGGGGGVPQKQTLILIRLRECFSDKGERVKKSENFCRHHMYMPPHVVLMMQLFFVCGGSYGT